MYVPMMSAGSKSGVNCTLLNLHPKADANVFAIKVLAVPGTSSIKIFPFDNTPTVILRKFSCLPIMTLETSFIRELEI